MASFVYSSFMDLLLNGGISFETDDIRILLVGPSSSIFTEGAKLGDQQRFLNEFSNLDEVSGPGYSRKQITSIVVSDDFGGSGWVKPLSTVTWSGIDVGEVSGYMIYKHVTDDTDSRPIMCYDGEFTFVNAPTTITPNLAGSNNFNFSGLGAWAVVGDRIRSEQTGQIYDIAYLKRWEAPTGEFRRLATGMTNVITTDPANNDEPQGEWSFLTGDFPQITNGSDIIIDFANGFSGIIALERTPINI